MNVQWKSMIISWFQDRSNIGNQSIQTIETIYFDAYFVQFTCVNLTHSNAFAIWKTTKEIIDKTSETFWSNIKVAASSESSTSVPSTLLTVSGTGGGITIGPNDGGIETTATLIETINDSTGTTTIQEVNIPDQLTKDTE